MLKKFAILSLAVAGLFVGLGQVQAQIDMSAVDALYMNLSLRQLGVPNPLNEPFYFGSPNAPTQTWHPNGGDMQAPVGYLGLFSLTNTDAVMRNLDTILQATGMTSNGAAFDPVYGMRYSNGLVNNAINTTAVSNGNTAPMTIPSSGILTNSTIDVGSASKLVVNSGTSSFSGGTLRVSGGSLTHSAGTMTINGGVLATSGTALISTSTSAGTLTLSGGSFASTTVASITTNGLIDHIVLSNPGSISNSSSTTTIAGGSFIPIGNTSVQSGTLTFCSGATVDTQVNYSVIANLTKIGEGTLNLSGTSTLQSSGTIIHYGGWLQNDYLQPLVVSANGAVLQATAMNVDALKLGGSVIVPEPSAFMLLAAAGIAGLFCRRLRRKS